MKLLILNGSPRMKGTTKRALSLLEESISLNKNDAEIDFYDISKMKLSACHNCDGCRRNGGTCVVADDGIFLQEKIFEADTLILGSPVYWWGITAQLKMVIDKFYSKEEIYFNKKMVKNIGLITVGASEVDNPQYRIIREQFECICRFLNWNLMFSKDIATRDKVDIMENDILMAEIKDLWKVI
ncbi:hypothetical protein AZF37_08385 [endosymbiont 'TC1' of Trimyema compressum]|uniref:flavodoxin family protein n=1 Tax=endosymbiont 'TC1' of Trimyema compressum TaxID=243899 RepID=UPI0007F114FB|nr:NAD(P)H-dependent oxidoreductase [endosymbiont 'TC1' of Trimyema compressum]AMP21173.1 hypothetical protein AZF37_08385 [endosymbiont 'TC1' of Trimyema compressum]